MNRGFTLIEALIAIAIFAIVATAVYSTYLNVLDITVASQLNYTALAVIGNELEAIRNIKYKDIGVQGGSPAGVIPAQKNINFSGFNFILNTTVRNVDDPFDGVLGGAPNDTAPADYRLVELQLSCTNCSRFIPITTTTTVGPANLESTSKNGNLFVTAIDASGQPIAGANVSIVNSVVNPTITINDITNNSGQLQLVDIATSSLGYQITVTKTGYSTDKTYQPGLPANPNPVKSHATVVSQQLTLTTFGIDRLSAQSLTTKDKFCQPVSTVDFNQKGNKLIGTDPDILKYSFSGATSATGVSSTDLEWDNYSLNNIDSTYDLAGTSLLSPFNVNPGTNYSINWLMTPKDQSSLLTVVQTSAGQFIDDAVITLSKTSFILTKISGHNYFSQTDWSGGQFSQKSLNLEEMNPIGELNIKQINGKYASMSLEWLESNTFDLGAAAIFYRIKWNPLSQPPQAGPDSLKFQIASNNDNNTWNFVGPDGSSNTYYTNSDSAISQSHNNNRYFRYKVYLMTQDHDFTPKLNDLEIEFSSSCIPAGQSFFSGLGAGTYNILIQKVGYQDFNSTVTIGGGWQEIRATLIP